MLSALRRPVLVALGLRPDGKKEIIDFRLAASESAAEWEKFLTDLYRHGLTHGLRRWWPRPAGCLADRPARHSRAALLGSQDQEHPRQSPQGRPAQVKRALHKVALHKVTHAHNQPAAPSAACQFADRFEEGLPQCGCMPARRPRRTAHLLPLQIRGATWKVRTTNAIERRFREVRRRTRRMDTFQDKTSMDRILFAVFSHENKSQSVSTLFLLTHNN